MENISEDEIYQIRTDILCNYYQGHKDDKLKNRIAEFLSRRNKAKDTAELYQSFLSRKFEIKEILLGQLADREKWQQENYLTGNCCRSMVKQMLTNFDIIHDGPFNWNEYYFWGDDMLNPQRGVILNQSVDVDYLHDKAWFKDFFAFILAQVTHPEKFLKYHLTKTFQSDNKSYRLFLKDCLDDLPVRKSFLDQWIKDELDSDDTDLNRLAASSSISFTKNQIALEYYYKIRAGTYPDLIDDKTKKIKVIAEEKGLSQKTLQTAITNALKPGKNGLEYRNNILKDTSNQIAIQTLLGSDHKAIQELKKEINNLGNPLT